MSALPAVLRDGEGDDRPLPAPVGVEAERGDAAAALDDPLHDLGAEPVERLAAGPADVDQSAAQQPVECRAGAGGGHLELGQELDQSGRGQVPLLSYPVVAEESDQQVLGRGTALCARQRHVRQLPGGNGIGLHPLCPSLCEEPCEALNA